MYCLNGTSGKDDQNTVDAVSPLFNLSFNDWWLHHSNGCDQFPPDAGNFLELPANGQFTVEHTVNRAFTTFSNGGKNTGTFTNGQDTPGVGSAPEGCITDPNIHTQNESMASGTAFAISYQSDISKVTPENLVIFTVLPNTPWKRIATFSVPNLPSCAPSGCICAWGWVPNGCGEVNMYMLPYRCKVTGTPGTRAVGNPAPPTWCAESSDKCISGPKQMIYFNQKERNNVVVSGNDASGRPKIPGYNTKMGFSPGAQTDIFTGEKTQSSSSTKPTSTSSKSRKNGSNLPSSIARQAYCMSTLFVSLMIVIML